MQPGSEHLKAEATNLLEHMVVLERILFVIRASRIKKQNYYLPWRTTQSYNHLQSRAHLRCSAVGSVWSSLRRLSIYGAELCGFYNSENDSLLTMIDLGDSALAINKVAGCGHSTTKLQVRNVRTVEMNETCNFSCLDVFVGVI